MNGDDLNTPAFFFFPCPITFILSILYLDSFYGNV